MFDEIAEEKKMFIKRKIHHSVLIFFLILKLSKLDEPDMPDTAGEARTSS